MAAELGDLKLVTAPADEPITLDEAKKQLREDGTDQDEHIESLIVTAREWLESTYGVSLLTQTWDYALSAFPSERELKLPRPPLVSVTSITYYDEDLSTSTVFSSANYQVDTFRRPGAVVLKNNIDWPTDTLRPSSGVVVRFVSGNTSAGLVPANARHAMKLLVSELYEHREQTVTGTIVQRIEFTVDRLMADLRVRWS